MRVYDLAKQLGMTNKELVDKIKSLGIDVKSHSSSLDDKSIRALMNSLGKTIDTQAGAAEAAAEAKEHAKRETRKKAEPAPPPEPPKPAIDARAIALEAIARAKAKRLADQQRQQAQPAPAAASPAPPATALPEYQDVDLGAKKPVLKAVVSTPVPSEKPASAPVAASAATAAPAAPAQPQQPRPVPHVAPPHRGTDRPPATTPPRQGGYGQQYGQQTRPQQPRPDQRGDRPDTRGPRPDQRGDRPGPRPGGDRPGGRPGGERPGGRPGSYENRPPRPGGPGAGPVRRGPVKLEQLPGLPVSKPSERPRRGERPEPQEELGKRPSRRVAATGTKKTAAEIREEENEKERKRIAREKGGHAEKKIRPGRFLNLDVIEEVTDDTGSRVATKPRPGAGIMDRRHGGRQQAAVVEREPTIFKVRGDVTVAEFADKIQVPASEVLTKAFELGEMLTMNKIIPAALCELIADELKVRIEIVPEDDEHDVKEFLQEDAPEQLVLRPPVVTVMGHVDHGKTTLLDSIRKTNVAGGEFGGITQHIGAYRVDTPRGEVVFLDTPGHEAFTAMRARGASVTDLVILVVAADDGLMPQTIEAINHAKAASVPIIVAINKIDLPGANIPKVRNALMQYSLVGEELGGDTIICEVSAKAGTGLDNLLEMVILQAEVMELRANPAARASGIVIESEVDPQRGINATILIQRGTLHNGDAFVCGDVSGRVRAMQDDRSQNVDSASPAHPVRIIGLSGCPQVGESFLVLENERQARQIAEVREARRRRAHQVAADRPHVTLESFSEFIKDDKPKTLNLVLKADVQGSVEAVSQAILRLSNPKITIQILHSGVGAVSESDVQLAMASDAVILGFNVRPDNAAAELAAQEKIEIKTYRVIYTLTEELQAAMLGMLDKKYREVSQGRAEVRQVFRIPRIGAVAGCYVTAGTVRRNDKARLVRDGVVVNEGSIATLRRIKDDVSSVQSGYECGLTLTDYQDYREGDIIEVYSLEEVAQVL